LHWLKDRGYLMARLQNPPWQHLLRQHLLRQHHTDMHMHIHTDIHMHTDIHTDMHMQTKHWP